jgi:hypothetical protein
MKQSFWASAALGAAACTLAGCSSDGNLLGSNLTTSSVDPAVSSKAAQASKVDPQCVALTTKIDGLRKEGVTERVEKASVGKSKTVSVKRDSLAKMTELDKANAEFQAKCSTLTPQQQAAATATPAAPAAQPVAQAAAQAKPAAPVTAAAAPVAPQTPKP